MEEIHGDACANKGTNELMEEIHGDACANKGTNE